MIQIKDIKENPDNPRNITADKLESLKKSIKDFEKMMALRPIIVDETNTVLGGNMRLKALKELGYTEIPDTWLKRADGLTDAEKREFIIKDNIGFGIWDWDTLAEWDDDLEDWGLEVDFNETPDFSDKNKEIDIDAMDADMTITLKYTDSDYWMVKQGLSKIAQTPEQAICKLLGYE
jgi:hypothetical protein